MVRAHLQDEQQSWWGLQPVGLPRPGSIDLRDPDPGPPAGQAAALAGVAACGPPRTLPLSPSSRPSSGPPPAWVQAGSLRKEVAGGWPVADRGRGALVGLQGSRQRTEGAGRSRQMWDGFEAGRVDGYTRQQASRQPEILSCGILAVAAVWRRVNMGAAIFDLGRSCSLQSEGSLSKGFPLVLFGVIWFSLPEGSLWGDLVLSRYSSGEGSLWLPLSLPVSS